jgi:hypothetical protein
MKTGLLITIIMAFLLSSCSVRRHVQKDVARSRAIKQSDSTVNATVISHTQAAMKEVITERVDTSLIVPAWSVTGSASNGEVALGNGGYIRFNPQHPDSFKIVMPAAVIPVYYTRRTEKTEFKTDDTKVKMQHHVVRKVETQSLNKHVDRFAEMVFKVPWWVWGLAAAGIFLAYRKVKSIF